MGLRRNIAAKKLRRYITINNHYGGSMEWNMKFRGYIILVAVIFLVGCVTDSGEKSTESQPVDAYSIKSIQASGRTVSFQVACTVPEPCWAFTRTEYAKSGDAYAVTVFARRTTSDPCLQVLSSIDAPFSVSVGSAGSYTFRFRRSDGTTVDTTITVQ
jgi:hypothetical protein